MGPAAPADAFFLEAFASVCWNSGRCTGLAGGVQGLAGMTISNDQIDAVVARLLVAFPQTFVLEKHLPHCR